MPKDGNKTRIKILDETTQLVLENGFSGTTIDHILDRTNITKGAFFYHFKSKADLAFSLMEYFSEKDIFELSHALKETEKYKDKPKQRLIAFVQYFIDVFQELDAPYAGCLYASYVYEPEQFSREIKEMVATSFLNWREAIAQMLEETAKVIPPKTEYDTNSLADLFTVTMEGAYITSKALNDANVTAKQLIHYRKYLELIFQE